MHATDHSENVDGKGFSFHTGSIAFGRKSFSAVYGLPFNQNIASDEPLIRIEEKEVPADEDIASVLISIHSAECKIEMIEDLDVEISSLSGNAEMKVEERNEQKHESLHIEKAPSVNISASSSALEPLHSPVIIQSKSNLNSKRKNSTFLRDSLQFVVMEDPIEESSQNLSSKILSPTVIDPIDSVDTSCYYERNHREFAARPVADPNVMPRSQQAIITPVAALLQPLILPAKLLKTPSPVVRTNEKVTEKEFASQEIEAARVDQNRCLIMHAQQIISTSNASVDDSISKHIEPTV